MEQQRYKTLKRDDRAQTLQDFAIGIGVFLVAFVFVLSLFPGLLTPFQSTASGSERAQAQQVSTEILSNYSAGPQQNNLSAVRMNTLLSTSSEADLLDEFGLASSANINITVETLDGTANVFKSTNDVRNRELATSTRLVTLADARCDPACRLVVRVW